MAQYGWASCPSSTRVQINTFCEHVRIILADNLSGIYLHGSLAMDCFNPDLSDIDLLILIQRTLTVEIKRDLIALLLQTSRHPQPIEISFLVQTDLHPYSHPLPYALHYSETWREQNEIALADDSWQTWNDHSSTDDDLDAHLTILQRRGVTLYGQDHRISFPVVPTSLYAQTIQSDYVVAREARNVKPIYFLLNACRVHAYLNEGHIYSKDEGGVYGLTTFPAEFLGLIAQALSIYRGRSRMRSFTEDTLTAFTYYMDTYIQTVSTHTQDT